MLTFPPGRGSRPPPPARRPGYPAAPPRCTAATSGTARSAGARPAGAGGSPLPAPGRPGCSWPSAWSSAPGPPRGPRTVPPESLREAGARARGRSLEGPGRASRRPRNPKPFAGRSRVPRPNRAWPLRPRPGARPEPGGPAPRTRGGTRPLAGGTLTHHSRFSSPPAPPPALLAAGRSGPVPTPEALARALGNLAPGGLSGHPHAGHAPRGRARALERGVGAEPSGRCSQRRLWIQGMRTACPLGEVGV